ncbi:hypothetical protein TanjilG_10557 [Lupinus angustifolius]|uniref:Uncharacterized protein n=1 Tax=Lupinus angustifolius TaxID=3871 RepID=A0A1J7FW71_LUPAN|nr:hypothetical protein TanjilG_10557 [Lupinus angustifolius]
MDAIINFELNSYDIKSILYSNAKSPTAKKVPTYSDILTNKVTSEALSSPSNTFFESQPLKLTLSNSTVSTLSGNNNQNPSGFKLSTGGTGLSEARTSGINAINGNNTSFAMYHQATLDKRSYSEASSSSSFPNMQPLMNKQIRVSSSNFFSFQRTGSRVGTSDNSIGNNGAMIPNQGANVEQPLTQNNPNDLGLGIGQDIQAPTQTQHNQLDDIINTEFYQYILNNNQALPQSPNLSFSDYNLPKLPSDFEIQLSPLVGTGLQDIDVEATATQEHDDAAIFLNNQSFPQSPSLTLVHHDANQNPDLKNDLTSNFPCENSSKSSFMNLHSEINTTSLDQVHEYLDTTPDLCLDPNSSKDSFQNPISEANTSSYGNMIITEKKDGLDSSQCLTNKDDLFHDPVSETNTGSQILTPGSQNDLNISDYLSDFYAVEEETDWIHRFGTDLGQQ